MKKVHCIRTLHQSLICETGGDEFKNVTPSSQNMENKLLKRFGEVCIVKGSTRQGNIIFSKTLSIFNAFHKENSYVKRSSLGAF